MPRTRYTISLILIFTFILIVRADGVFTRIPANCNSWLTDYKEGNAKSDQLNIKTEFQGEIVDAIVLISSGNNPEKNENSHFPCNINESLDPAAINIFGFSTYISFKNSDLINPDLRAFEFGGSIWTATERRECVLLFQFDIQPYISADIQYHIGGIEGWQQLTIPTGKVIAETFSTSKKYIMDKFLDGNFHYINLECSINNSGEVEYRTLTIDDDIFDLSRMNIPPSPATPNIYRQAFVTIAFQADGRNFDPFSFLVLIPEFTDLYYSLK